jgi:hypothetical protein
MQTVKSVDINAVDLVSYDAYVCDDNNTKYEKEEKVNRRIKKKGKERRRGFLFHQSICAYIYIWDHIICI